jgi:hypothetical protein
MIFLEKGKTKHMGTNKISHIRFDKPFARQQQVPDWMLMSKALQPA